MSNPTSKPIEKPKNTKPVVKPKKEETDDLTSWLGDGLARQVAETIKDQKRKREEYLNSI